MPDYISASIVRDLLVKMGIRVSARDITLLLYHEKIDIDAPILAGRRMIRREDVPIIAAHFKRTK